MKQFFLLLVLSTTISFANVQKDSISSLELKVIQLENGLQNLQNNINKNEQHIKDLLAENEKLSDSNFEKVDSRLTNFIWLISVLGGLIVAASTFFGWRYLSSSINGFFIERAQKLADKKLNSLITEEWLRVEVEKKSKSPIEKAVENLQLDFLAISEQMIDDEKAKMQAQHARAKKTVEEIEKLRDKLEEKGLDQKSDELSKEEKIKVKEAADTPKKEADFNWEDWFWKGRNAYEEQKYKEAKEAFLKVYELNPHNLNISTWLGRTNHKIGKYKEAIKNFDDALIVNPKNYFDLAWRADSKRIIGLYNEALEDISKVIKYRSQSIPYLCIRAIIYLKLGKDSKAISELNNISNLESKNELDYVWIGYLKNNLKMYEEALLDFKSSIDIKRKSNSSYAHMAYSYIMLDKIEKAIYFNEKALKNTPNNGRPYFNLGLIKHNQEELKEACEAWKKALEFGFIDAQEKLDEFCKEEEK